MKIHINTLGIIFTTIGSFLVWKYIKILSFIDYDEYLKGNGVVSIPTPTKDEINKFLIGRFLSNLGLFLIVIGGILQVISNYLP